MGILALRDHCQSAEETDISMWHTTLYSMSSDMSKCHFLKYKLLSMVVKNVLIINDEGYSDQDADTN